MKTALATLIGCAILLGMVLLDECARDPIYDSETVIR
jgi:hypothetical protein